MIDELAAAGFFLVAPFSMDQTLELGRRGLSLALRRSSLPMVPLLPFVDRGCIVLDTPCFVRIGWLGPSKLPHVPPKSGQPTFGWAVW